MLALTEQTVEEFQNQFSQISADATRLMGDLMDDMRFVVKQLDVPSPKEGEVLELIDSHVSLITGITRRCDSVEQNFGALKSSIDRITDECDVDLATASTAKPATFDSERGSIELF